MPLMKANIKDIMNNYCFYSKYKGLDIPDGCCLHVKTFGQLTTTELYALLRTRSEVFVVEQDCVYQDVDNCDQTAIHLWMTSKDKIVAQCRICPGGTKMDETSIGRVVTTERGKGYGKFIMRAAIETAKQNIGNLVCIDIEAQADKRIFYENLGFVAKSEPFMMEGLLHMHMRYVCGSR